MNKTALVVSAHSADFVWRAGGAIALHAAAGWDITVVCLSYGERGESAKLWRKPGMTLEKVKAERQRGRERPRQPRRRQHPAEPQPRREPLAQRADQHDGYNKASSRLRTHAGDRRSMLLPS